MRRRPQEDQTQPAWPMWFFLAGSWFLIMVAELLFIIRSGGALSSGSLLWRGLLYFLPIGLGWGVANALVISFLRIMYDIDSWVEASAFWERLRTGNASGLLVVINRDTFVDDKPRTLLLRVGGPGVIQVGEQDVVVTEINGRVAQVLGPGRHVLQRFEYVRTVVDLRQQEYRNYAADARHPQEIIRLVTRDGIEIEADVTIIYRIAPDDSSVPNGSPLTEVTEELPPTLPTKARPYPFGEKAVRRAAYAETLSGRKTLTWKEKAVEETLDMLRHVAAQYALDKLVYPDESGAIKPYHTLQDKMEKQARQKLRRFGVRLIHARIDRLRLPPEVTDQMIETWVAPHERARQVELAKLQAGLNRDVEVAQAEQNAAVARGIVEGMQQAKIEGNGNSVTEEVVALRLAGALRTLQRRLAQNGK